VGIEVSVKGDGYVATVSPNPLGGATWLSGEPMSGRALSDTLVKLGCHQTDVGDAFYQADPNWLSHLDGFTRQAGF
jgi:hypothetical protein